MTRCVNGDGDVVPEQDASIVHEQDRHIVTEIDLTLNTGCGGQISEHFCTTFCDGHQPGPVLPNLSEPMCQPDADGPPTRTT